MHVFIRQRGSALLVSLVFLLLLTMIGISSIQDSTLQERMAGNNRDQGVAFQAAEAGLRAAERTLELAVVGPFNGTNGLYAVDSPSLPDWKASSHTGWMVLSSGLLVGVDSQPEYVIEEIPEVGQVGVETDSLVDVSAIYRVTARGYGVSQDSRVVLQSTYRR